MRSNTLKATLIAVLSSTCLCIPALTGTTPGQEDPRLRGSGSPLAGMVLPPGEGPAALDMDTLKAQVIALRNSLTDQQRSQILEPCWRLTRLVRGRGQTTGHIRARSRPRSNRSLQLTQASEPH